MTNQTIELMKTRRAIKSFNDQPVTEEQLDAILEAGIWAASGRGKQAPVSVAVTDPEIVSWMSKTNAGLMGGSGDPFYGSKCVVVVFTDGELFTGVEDGSLVIGNMMLAAHSLGVGSCWIHRAKEVFETPEGRQLMKKWGVPDSYVGVGNCVLGFWDGEYPGLKPRREGRIIKVK